MKREILTPSTPGFNTDWFKVLWVYLESFENVLYLFSMGVGRTGVFIALSIALERMRYEGVIDLFQTVKMLRTQRPAMVQTEVSVMETYEYLFSLWRLVGVFQVG